MIKRLISCSTLLFFVMCSAALATPERSDVANYLRGALPSSLNLDTFQFRVFEGESGTGRVSISGNASLQTELYDIIRGDGNRAWFLEKALSDGVGAEVDGVQGLSDALRLTPTNIQDAHQDFLRDHRGPLIGSNPGNYVILVPTAEVGTRVSFQYEVNYRATVSGFDFRALDQAVNMPRGYSLQASRQRYGGTAVVRGSNDAQTIVDFIIGIAMEKAREEVGTLGELERMKADFRSLVSGDIIWGSRMLITGCDITGEYDEQIMQTDRPRGTLTAYAVQASCSGISSSDSRDGRFRFMDGLEVYPDQTRPLRIQLFFPRRHSVGSLDSYPQHWFNICLQIIDEDAGRGGVFASRHTLGEFSCVGGANQFGGSYAWLDDRSGFAAPNRGQPIVSVAAAPEDVDLSNFRRRDDQESYSPAADNAEAGGRVAEPEGDDTDTVRTTGSNLVNAMRGKTWAGVMTQGSQMYRIEVDAQASNIRVIYPSLPCSGVWEIVESSDSEIVFREIIQDGRDVCVGVGFITASEQANGEISVGWARSRDGTLMTHAVLSQD